VSTVTEEFAKTATAAKLSGNYNETAGYFKRNWGKLTGDEALKDDGRNQQILGKVHRLVGSLRTVRETVIIKVKTTRVEGQALCRKHAGRAIDVASDFVDDVKKTFFR